MSIPESILQKVTLRSHRNNRGIGYDLYFVSYQNKRYVFRIENSETNSKLKLNRHRFLLQYISADYMQQLIQIGILKGRHYFITSYIQGKIPSKLSGVLLSKIFLVLRKVHTINARGAGHVYPDFLKGNCANWKLFIENTLSNLKDTKFQSELFQLNQMYNELKSILQHREAHSLLHGDLNKNNIIIKDGKIYLLDWENALIGDSLADYAILDNFFELNILNRSHWLSTESSLITFYKRFFLIKEIDYKKNHGMSVKEDIKKLHKIMI